MGRQTVLTIISGETIYNVEKLLQGQQGGKLTERGIQQAKAVAYRLSSEVFDAAYVSDLDRTKETASYIFPYHKNLVVNYDPRLREKSGGVLEGKALGTPSIEAKVFMFHKKLGISIRDYKPEKGESWIDVNKRARMFLEDIINKHLFTKPIEEKINKYSQSSNSLCLKYFGNYKDIPECGKLITKNPPISKYRSSSNTKQMRRTLKQFNMAPSFHKPTDLKVPIKPQKKILVITHGGWMMEFKNAILALNGKPIVERNISKNTSIYIYRAICANCKGVCLSGCNPPKAKIQCILENDDSHLQSMHKISKPTL